MLTFFKNRVTEIMEVATILSYLLLTVEEEESDENEGSFEILLYFEAAIIAE